MATLTIRNLPQEVLDRLKERAKLHGHSMEQEAREILGQRLAARSEILAEIRSQWAEAAPPPSAAEVRKWIDAGRRGRR